VCIIGHGSSNDIAIFNSIRVAHEFAKAGTNERIEQEFAGHAKHARAARPARADHPADSGANPDATVQ